MSTTSILLAEDDPFIGKMATRNLEAVGCEVIHATTVREAISVLEHRGDQLQASVLDGNLPLDEGMEVEINGEAAHRIVRTMQQLDLLRPGLIVVGFSSNPFQRYQLGPDQLAPAAFIDLQKSGLARLGSTILRALQSKNGRQ